MPFHALQNQALAKQLASSPWYAIAPRSPCFVWPCLAFATPDHALPSPFVSKLCKSQPCHCQGSPCRSQPYPCSQNIAAQCLRRTSRSPAPPCCGYAIGAVPLPVNTPHSLRIAELCLSFACRRNAIPRSAIAILNQALQCLHSANMSALWYAYALCRKTLLRQTPLCPCCTMPRFAPPHLAFTSLFSSIHRYAFTMLGNAPPLLCLAGIINTLPQLFHALPFRTRPLHRQAISSASS